MSTTAAARPNFVIAGAQKAASTLLAKALGEHPEISMPPGETHYFRDPEYATRSPSQLDDLFPNSSAKRRGIKCPDYLGQEPCASRIIAELGRIDTLVTLRNPVDRAISAYFWRVRWGQLPVEDVETGISRLLSGTYDGVRQAREILSFGEYGRHVDRWIGLLGHEHFLCILDSDLFADYAGTLMHIHRFLNLEPAPPTQAVPARSNEGVYHPARLHLLRMRNRWVYDDGNPMTGRLRRPAKPVASMLNGAVVLSDRHIAARLLGNDKPQISTELRSRLIDYYADDIRRLQGLIGRDLSSWLTVNGR